MPRKKKPVKDYTTEESVKKVFPKKVVEKVKEIAHEKDSKN
jgi:hypothetical protein